MNSAKMKSVNTAHQNKKHLPTKMCTRLFLLHMLISNSCQGIYIYEHILKMTGHNSVDLKKIKLAANVQIFSNIVIYL